MGAPSRRLLSAENNNNNDCYFYYHYQRRRRHWHVPHAKRRTRSSTWGRYLAAASLLPPQLASPGDPLRRQGLPRKHYLSHIKRVPMSYGQGHAIGADAGAGAGCTFLAVAGRAWACWLASLSGGSVCVRVCSLAAQGGRKQAQMPWARARA